MKTCKISNRLKRVSPFLVLFLLFVSCTHGSDVYKTTLILNKELKRNNRKQVDSIVFTYRPISNNTAKVEKVCFVGKSKAIVNTYYLVSEKDRAYIKHSVNDTLKALYLDVQPPYYSNSYFNPPQPELLFNLKYIKTLIIGRDTLLLFKGSDIGVNGDSYGYYYFDKKYYLRMECDSSNQMTYLDPTLGKP